MDSKDSSGNSSQPMLKAEQESLNSNIDKNLNKAGLSIIMAVFFIVGEMAGTGIVNLPQAISQTGWIGCGFLILCACMASFTGTKLGECWNFIIQKEPRYKEDNSAPYPTIAEKAAGRYGRILVNCTVYITLFMACVVIWILCARNTSELVKGLLKIENSLFAYPCFMAIMLWVVITPLTMQDSPAEMPWVAICATLTTVLACVLILVQIFIDDRGNHSVSLNETVIPEVIAPSENSDELEKLPKLLNLTTGHLEEPSCGDEVGTVFIRTCSAAIFGAFGKIVFCFGGMAMFPTIQCDMKKPRDFNKVVLLSMTALITMMMPIAAAAYAKYNSKIGGNILEQIDRESWLTITANILLTSHLLFAVVIIQNPVAQLIESFFKIEEMGFKRVLVRASISTIVLLTGLAVPKFDFLLGLVGSSMIMVNTFIAPSIFYLLLVRKNLRDSIEGKTTPYLRYNGDTVQLPKYEYCVHGLCIFMGIVFGIVGTVTTFMSGSGLSSIVPCFVNFKQSVNISH